MKYFITTLLLFHIIIINTSAQTWNTQMVNPGTINGSQTVSYTSSGNPVLLLRSGNSLLFSRWNGNSWINKIVYTSTSAGWSDYFILKIDTMFLIGWRTHPGATTSGSLNIVVYSEEGNQIQSRGKSFGYANQLFATKSNSGDSILVAYSYTTGVKYISYNILNNLWGEEIMVDNSPSLSRAAITVSPTNRIWISYYDSQGQNLKTARSNLDGSWNIYFVDTEGSVGLYSEIWVDNTNTAHIAYYDATNQKLKYATFNPD